MPVLFLFQEVRGVVDVLIASLERTERIEIDMEIAIAT